jgi:hypothetical protein
MAAALLVRRGCGNMRVARAEAQIVASEFGAITIIPGEFADV